MTRCCFNPGHNGTNGEASITLSYYAWDGKGGDAGQYVEQSVIDSDPNNGVGTDYKTTTGFAVEGTDDAPITENARTR